MRPDYYSEGPYRRMLRENKRRDARNRALVYGAFMMLFMALGVCEQGRSGLGGALFIVILFTNLAICEYFMFLNIKLSMAQWR